MINISKNMSSEPNTLKKFRLSKDVKKALKANEKGMFDKYVDEYKADELREILKQKQGAICCYCMCSVETGKTKIEHFYSRENSPNLEVDYSNLYLACDGEKVNCNENQDDNNNIYKKCRCKYKKEIDSKRIVKHCDTCKDSRTLKHIDFKNIESCVKYKSDGTIYSDDKDIDRELNYVLNLNIKILKENRSQAKNDLWKNLPKDGTWKKDKIQGLIEKYQNQSKKAPYLGVLIYFLKRKLPKEN